MKQIIKLELIAFQVRLKTLVSQPLTEPALITTVGTLPPYVIMDKDIDPHLMLSVCHY